MSDCTFDWVCDLPAEDLATLVSDLVAAIEARPAADNELIADLRQTVHEWRNTAVIYADPKLLAILSAPVTEDLGPVPDPRLTAPLED